MSLPFPPRLLRSLSSRCRTNLSSTASHGRRLIRSGAFCSIVSQSHSVSHLGVTSRPIFMPRRGLSVLYHVDDWEPRLPTDGFRGHHPFLIAAGLGMEVVAPRHRASFEHFLIEQGRLEPDPTGGTSRLRPTRFLGNNMVSI
jgi:hypothetical protein